MHIGHIYKSTTLNMGQNQAAYSYFALMSYLLRVLLLLAASWLGSCQFAEVYARYGNFTTYKENYAKTYPNEVEQNYRKGVHLDNLRMYDQHNQKGNYSFTAGVNRFSDMTHKEYVATHLRNLSSATSIIPASDRAFKFKSNKSSLNWVKENRTTPVKDQGNCGASWAFSVIASVEALFKNRSFPDPDLSEQQLIDCANLQGGSGCEHGLPEDGLEYIRVHGVTLQMHYPLAPTPDARACRTDIEGMFKISDWKKKSGCAPIQEALERGPMPVTVNAWDWNVFAKGMYDKCVEEFDKNPNLVALLVGWSKKYKDEGDDDYWLLQTPWGNYFADKGIIKVSTKCADVCQNGYVPQK